MSVEPLFLKKQVVRIVVEEACSQGYEQLSPGERVCWSFIHSESEPVLPLHCFLVTDPVRTRGKTDRLNCVFHEARASRICLWHVCAIKVGCSGHTVP